MAQRSISRTTTSSGRPQPRHKAAVTELVQRIYDAGDIYEGVYEGWYCVGCEAFKPEKELVNGRCPLHPQTEPQWIKEKNYFFRLSKYQKPLLEHFQTASRVLRARQRAATSSSGCSRAGSRTSRSAGPARRGAFRCRGIPSSVVYVWFDALINYAAAVGLGTDPERFDTWWPADLHVIGKDITRFHTVIWPAMLMSAGLPLPRKVFAHGFMTVNGQRMSKSNPGTIIDPLDAAEAARRRSAPAVPREGSCRSATTAIFRGSGSTSATTPISRTTSATSSAA